MLKIYIARHGQDEDNANFILNGHRDLPLTELGRQQARALAEGIRKAKLTLGEVYTSPLCRAYETAAIVVDTLSLPKPLIIRDLVERHFGVMTGRRIEEIEKICSPEHILKTDTITYFLEAEGAEDYPTAYARARRVLQRISKQHKTGSVLLVTHSDFGKLLYAAYYGIAWRDVLTMFHFGNSELLLLAHDSRPEEVHVIRIEQYNH